MSHESTLTAAKRDRVGKGAARELRRNGHTPAVIYGNKEEALPIAISSNEINKLVRAGGFMTTIFSIDVAGTTVRALPKDYQLDPVKDFVTHVDFLRVTANMMIEVDIPVHFQNQETCPGLKAGGTLNVVRHTVEVTCPADNIPDEIVIDLNPFKLGDSIHISHVALPKGVTPTITDRDFTIATIATPAGLASETNAADGE